MYINSGFRGRRIRLPTLSFPLIKFRYLMKKRKLKAINVKKNENIIFF